MFFLAGLASPATAQETNGDEEIFAEIRSEAEAIGLVRSLLVQQHEELVQASIHTQINIRHPLLKLTRKKFSLILKKRIPVK